MTRNLCTLRSTGSRCSRTLTLVALVCIGVVAVGCGNDSNDSGAVTIHAGDRLAWDQVAASVDQLRSLSFKLYVDGSVSALQNVNCDDTAGASGFTCSGRLPSMSAGKHTLELTSVLNGQESPRSRLTVSQQSSSSLNADAAAATIRVGAASTTPTACGPTGCYQAQVVAAGLVSATSLAATRDRTLFFIEADRQIRVIANDSLLGDPALVAVDGSRIVGLAVDDGSDGVPSVFVSWTETTPAGRTVVNVTRYRALQNVLGQAAQILTGLPFTEGAFAPLTVSGDGLLYVALPAAEDSSALRRATTGVVMRVTRDGFTPSSVAQASPVHVAADAWPTSLSADRLKTVWSAGRAEDGTRVIAAIDATAPRVAPLSVDGLASAPLVRPALPDPVLSVADGTNIAMAAEGQLFVGQPANGKITVENIVVNGGSRVQGIVQVPDGSLYVSVSTAERSVTVVRLRRP